MKSLGDRMKEFYEAVTQIHLPRRTFTIIRLDGKAFHSYTEGLGKPFDSDFMRDMDKLAAKLCSEIQGAVLAYVQSDEISILVTDFKKLTTDAWYKANIQKIVSVSASIAGAYFNVLRGAKENGKIAYFDSRVFTIPHKEEVVNYFLWRQQDCMRNSVNTLAQANFSHKDLQGKCILEVKEMLHVIHKPWEILSGYYKFGRLVFSNGHIKPDMISGDMECKSIDDNWMITPLPYIGDDRELLSSCIPEHYDEEE